MQKISDWNIMWLDTVDSTSAEIHRRMPDLLSFSAIAAVSQSAGRGQGDHKWHSEAGENLTFSIYVEYDAGHSQKAQDQTILTMASSVAVARYLQTLGLDASIKKPNDVYIGDKKICGMLIENGLNKGLMKWSIVGIGLNLNQETFPDDLPNPVSAFQLTGRKYDIRKCLEDFLTIWKESFEQMWDAPSALEEEYLSRIISWQRQ